MKDLKKIFIGDKTKCKCLDLGIKTKNPKIKRACIHQLILKLITAGCTSLIIQ